MSLFRLSVDHQRVTMTRGETYVASRRDLLPLGRRGGRVEAEIQVFAFGTDRINFCPAGFAGRHSPLSFPAKLPPSSLGQPAADSDAYRLHAVRRRWLHAQISRSVGSTGAE